VLSRARGFLNPIQWEEPFGMVMIEAMALGCPVIAFERGAAAEIVAHGSSGFLVEDVNGMVDAIARIDELDRMVVRAHAEHHFTVQAMVEKYSRVYKKTIASSMGKMASEHASSKDAPVLISPSSRALMPLSLTYMKRDVSALLPYQASRGLLRPIEVRSGVHTLPFSAIERLREKETKHRATRMRIKGSEKENKEPPESIA
jgi:hypothetical protein